MPESFDTMLAELADVAAEAIVPPGLAEVRRRARERTLRRRMTASAIALTLISVVGGGWAVAQHHFDKDDTIAPVAGQNTSSSAPSSAPSAAEARAMPSASAVGGAYAFTGGSDVVVWKSGAAQDNYLMIFSDGTVALSTAGSFPLCYGRLAASTTSILPVTIASVPVAGTASASAALKAAGALAGQQFADVACDNFGTKSGITAAPAGDGNTVWLTVSGSTDTAETFSRVAALDGGGATGGVLTAARLKELAGTWTSADANKRVLQIGADGLISFIAYANAGKPYSGNGRIDTAYPTGARAVFGCAGDAAASTGGGAVSGGATVTGTSGGTTAGGSSGGATPCEVLLIQQSSQSFDQITVYGSYGPEAFIRKG
jgi:hypothetical protein